MNTGFYLTGHPFCMVGTVTLLTSSCCDLGVVNRDADFLLPPPGLLGNTTLKVLAVEDTAGALATLSS